jgi:hypothetical protein
MGNGLRTTYVNGGSLLFFFDQNSQTFQEDVLTCTLACQLAASRKHSAFSEFADWHKQYFDTLTSFKCPIDYQDVQSIPLEADESIWSRLQRMLAKRVSASRLAEAATAITNMANNVDHDASLFLCKQTVQLDPDQGSLLLPSVVNVPALPGGSDKVSLETPDVYDVTLMLGFMGAAPMMSLVMISFKSCRPIKGLPLAELFSSGAVVGNLDVAIIGAELDGHDFSYLRQAIIEKLGSRREELRTKVAGLEP